MGRRTNTHICILPEIRYLFQVKFGWSGEARTHNLLINSQMQLPIVLQTSKLGATTQNRTANLTLARLCYNRLTTVAKLAGTDMNVNG